MTASEICIVVFLGIGTLLIAIPAIYMGVDNFQERQKRKRLFTRILYEMEKIHKDGHEANFILVSDKIKIPDFDRVLGVPIEMAVLPKGVQFIVAERKVKEQEK